MKAFLLALFGLALSTHAWIARAEKPLLAFCLAKAPDDEGPAAIHKERCPAILDSAVKEEIDSAAADAAKAKADLEKAQLENLAKAFPTQTAAADKVAVDIKGFKHFAQFRQASLLNEAGDLVASKVSAFYKNSPSPRRVLVLSQADVESLRRNTLPVQSLVDELDAFKKEVDNRASACTAPAGNAGAGSMMTMGSPLIVADAVLGFSLKLAQAFQTTLGATEAADLGEGANDVLLAGLASSWAVSGAPLYFGLPPISEDNPVVKALADLRTSTNTLIIKMGKDEKTQCFKDGKALLEVVQSRLTDLNKTTDLAMPSPLLTVMRVAELAPLKATPARHEAHALVLEALHSGGSVSIGKSPFTSQRVTAIATVTASYRLEQFDGQILSAGVISCPAKTTELDVVRYTKTFETSTKIARKEEVCE